MPKAVVSLKPGEAATAQEIIPYCRKCLARYTLPKSVEFVEGLPKGSTGKILKNVLKQRYCDDSGHH